jgi:hypothetical protein
MVVLLTFATPTSAQQAGTNVNVLPVVPPVFDGDGNLLNPNWYLVGDGYLQRQVEPEIIPSSLNPDHLLACFNDYRAVDVATGDVGLGEGEITTFATKIARILMPPEIGNNLPKGELVPPINAAEAWIGCSRSYDGGYTWSGFYLPGAPLEFYEEGSPPTVSTGAPIYGLDAATDPVLAAGPCGRMYVGFVAFTRSGESKVGVAIFRDTNALEGGDTIVYEGMEIVESGNNAEFGYFLDKPDLAVDLLRGSEDQCAHRVYMTYSTFNGLTKDEKVQTKMNFAASEATDTGGLSFTTTKINKNFGQNQGSAIAIDSRPGEPGRLGGGGTVYVFWRHFFDPDAIIWTRTVDYGVKWSAPAILTTSPALEPFDQPTIALGVAPEIVGPPALNSGFPELGFRTNGFPTATVAPYLVEGGNPDNEDDWMANVFVAWQELVDPISKEPSAANTSRPQIVMMRTDSDVIDWEAFDSSGNSQTVRQAIDLFDRYEPFDPYFLMPPDAPTGDDPELRRDPGAQVQPKLTSGGGRLMLTFYESRGRIGNYGSVDDPYESGALPEYLETNAGIVDFTPYISGYDRVVDLRASLLEPETGARISSAQISRYPLRIGAILDDGQQLWDVAAINNPCSPDDGPGLDACVRQVNRANAPTSAEGSSPFLGDYTGAVPYVEFVPDGSGGWRWAIRETDVPNRGFHAIWADNRHLDPPDPAPDEWDGYQFYGPPEIGGACFNPGSRNTDVLTSRVATDVLVSAPTTYKQLDTVRSFPFSISNTTGEFRRFELEITDGLPYVTFSPIKDGTGNPVIQTTYSVIVFPYSNSSLTVYVYPPDVADPNTEVGPIQVEVMLKESTTDPDQGTNSDPNLIGTWPDPCYPATEDCLVGNITFNAYPGNDPLQNLPGEEEFGPEISNAFVINWKPSGSGGTEEPETAFVINNFLDNAFVINAFVINSGDPNAFVINDGLDNAFVINTEVQNAFVINRTDPLVYSISDTVWTMTPTNSNTAASYVPQINIDNAAELQGYYAWQLIVDKNSAYGDADACDAYASNVPQQQVLSNVVQNPSDPNAFVINDFVDNAFVINTEVQNAFVINSAFTLPPSGGGGTKAGLGDSISAIGLGGPPAPSEVKITLRAFQLKPDNELPIDQFTGKPIKYRPEIAPPTLTVFHEACDPTDETDICYARNGADLIIPAEFIDTSDLTAPPCGSVDFPAFVMRNQGNADAIARPRLVLDEDGNVVFQDGEPVYEKQQMRHAIFLSDDEHLDLGTDRLLEETEFFSDNVDFRLAGQDDPDREPGDRFDEPFGPRTVTIPSDVTGGEYYLILYVDYPREASEYDETNNTVAIKLTVGGSLEFQGLQKPLLDTTSITGANAGSVVPLKWLYLDPTNGQIADSSDPKPTITFSGWYGDGVDCGSYDPENDNPLIVFTDDEDPGSSSLRYSDGTWQFNWQGKWPEGTADAGDPLPNGCYEITITRGASQCETETAGPFKVELN